MQIQKSEIVQNDSGYDLNFILQDYNGNAVNLTGGTLVLKVQKENTSTVKFTGTMTIVNATTGTCKYTVQIGNFDESGKYDAEVEVTIGSQIVTYTGLKINVLPELPK